MFKRKINVCISRMASYMDVAIGGEYSQTPCAEEIKPIIKAFFKKAMNAKVDWDETEAGLNIERITEIVMELAMNTRNYEELRVEDVISLKKIFDELDVLYTEAIEVSFQSKYDEYNFCRKIDCIKEIVCKNNCGMHDSKEKHENYRDGMIFQSYENLWKVIHRVNTEWNELCGRGFSLRVFYDYWESFKYDRTCGLEKSEEEKFTSFMAVLDGKKKFIPIYEKRPVCFKVVDNDFEGEIVNTIENRCSEPYRLSQDGEEAQSVKA